jgi:hypothetical protein
MFMSWPKVHSQSQKPEQESLSEGWLLEKHYPALDPALAESLSALKLKLSTALIELFPGEEVVALTRKPMKLAQNGKSFFKTVFSH